MNILLISLVLTIGFLSWDSESSHVDLEKELQALTSQAPEGEEARNGERLIQYATENLVTEVLIHPQVNTLLQCVRNLLSSFTRHRHLIHAGYTCAGNGSWILQDGTFSLADFIDAFVEPEVQRVLRAYENCVTVDVHCSPEGDWATERIAKEPFARSCKVRVNPDDRLTAGGTPIGNFINYINPFLRPASLEQLLEPSDVVGNIRFSHPTLYVFPGGQGDAALFGINGFNMLVDGGFARKACFWDFARHLDRLDAVLMTRLNNGNVNGISAVLRRKKQTQVYPQIGHFFCNLQERRHATSPDGDKDRDALLIDLLEEGQEIVLNLRHLQLRPHPCYREGNHAEPVNLYHKVGHGKLDMYIISPTKDSRDVKEFLSKWNSNDPRLFGGRKDGASLKEFHFPLQNLVSICALLVWQPANPNDTITRILFPGSTPQHKIFEGLDKLRHLEFLKHPVCTARSISPSASTVGIMSRASSKQRSAPAVIDKLLPGEGVKAISKTIGSAMETNKQAIKTATIPVAGNLPDVKQTKPATTAPTSAPVPLPSKAPPQTKQKVDRLTSKTEPPKMKTEINKSLEAEKISAKTEKATKTTVTETPKSKVEPKVKSEPRTSLTKTKLDSKPPRSADRKSQKPPAEKKSESAKSSPTTPKKSVEGKMNGVASKAETAKFTRTSSRTRPSPTATPAKSTKDANNRKVVESKYQHVSRVSSTARSSATKVTRKEDAAPTASKTERKPISRRPKPASPSKVATAGKSPGSPAKSSSAKSTPTPSVKSDKDGVIRKVKGEADKIATDSSAVSTPSTVEPETAALKVKSVEAEMPETAAPEPEKLTKEREDEIAPEKEIEIAVKSKDTEIETPSKKIQSPTTEVPVDEIQVQEVESAIQVKQEEELPAEEKPTEESPIAEIEVDQEGAEEEETEDKESEIICEEIKQEKLVVEGKEDVELAEEEEKLEEEEEVEEQEIEGRKSLADELEYEARQNEEVAKAEVEEEEDEEDEYLIIEKEEVEQYMEDSLQEQESVESHVPEEPEMKDVQDEEEEEEEGELQKHLRDEVESEKEKKHETEVDKETAEINGFPEETKYVTEKEIDLKEDKISPLKEDLKEEMTDVKPHDSVVDRIEPGKEEESKVMEEVSKQVEDITNVEEEEVPASKEMTAETKEQLQEEVQEIITSAKEIVTKTKREVEPKTEDAGEGSLLDDQKDLLDETGIEEKKDIEEGEEVKETSSISPEEKLDISSEKNREVTDDTRDTDQKLDEEEGVEVKAVDQRYPAEESQPDERFSTTVESAATTAPTLPEDERIPLDEIKEIVEEKYVKEETKEEKPTDITAAPPRLEQPTTLPQVVVAAGVGMFDPMAPHAVVHLQRDIVKTPDEVADLPVHEEVDPGMYESDEFSRDYKTKDDVTKKQLPPQELEDSRRSPDLEIKGGLQFTEKPPALKDTKDESEEKPKLDIAEKEEPKEAIETEYEKKTEITKEADTSKIVPKDDTPETHEEEVIVEKLKDDIVVDEIVSKEISDIKEVVENIIPEEKADIKEIQEPDIVGEDKKTEIDEEVTTLETQVKSDVDGDKKLDIRKDVPEQEIEEVTKQDSEQKESDLELDKEKSDIKEEIDHEEIPLKSEEVVKESADEEIKEEASEKLYDAHISEGTKEVITDEVEKEQDVLQEKSIDEQQKLVSKDELKQVTEEFIEKESVAMKFEAVSSDKIEEKTAISEITKETVSEPVPEKLESKSPTDEKTDLEKPVQDISEQKEPALEDTTVEVSEEEKFEVEVMEIKKSGKEQVVSDRESSVSTEHVEMPKEKSVSEYVAGIPKEGGKEVPDIEKQVPVHPEPTPEVSKVQDKLEVKDADIEKVQFEDEKLEKEQKESEKLDKEKLMKEELKTEEETLVKSEKSIKPETDTFDIKDSEVEKHDVDKITDSEEKPVEVKEDTETSKIEMKDEEGKVSHLDAEQEDETVTKEMFVSKEETTSDEKDIDEKDKLSKDLSLKPSSTEKDLPATEVPKLMAEEKEEKTSPSALSMTYLEIIDKLQKDSQKTDDSADVSTEAKALPLTEEQQDATDIKSEDTSFEKISDTIQESDQKVDMLVSEQQMKPSTESTQDVTETSFTQDDTIKVEDTIQKTDELPSGKSLREEEKEPIIKTDQHEDTKDISEHVPVKLKELDIETKTESVIQELSEESSKKESTELKLDETTDSSEVKESVTTSPPHPLTETEHKDVVKKMETEESIEVVEKCDETKEDLDETGLQAELKLSDEKDDSFGDGSISPGDAYVDSGLEEEPVYGKLEAPEVPEYVTVTPDSAPSSPKLQKEQKSLHKVQEDVIQESREDKDKTEKIVSEKDDSQVSSQKLDSITLDKDSTKTEQEQPTKDLGISSQEDEKDETHVSKAIALKDETAIKQTEFATEEVSPTSVPTAEVEKSVSPVPAGDQVNGRISSDLPDIQKVGEANVLEDVVILAEIESKTLTHVKEILTEPRKEKETISSILEIKSEIPLQTDDKDKEDSDKYVKTTTDLPQKEVKEALEDDQLLKESKSFPEHVAEKEELTSTSHEDIVGDQEILKEEKIDQVILKEDKSDQEILKEDESDQEILKEDKSDQEILKEDKILIKEETSLEAYESPEEDKVSIKEPHSGDLQESYMAESTTVTKKTEILEEVKKLDAKEIKTEFSVTSISEQTAPAPSETHVSETVDTEIIDSTTAEKPVVTTTKETTVVTSKATSVISSDTTCTTTSSITEITTAETIAEKETSAIITSTIATVSAAEKEKESESAHLEISGTVRRMVVTASSEDGGTEIELCPSGSITFAAPASSATTNGESPTFLDEELPGTSTSSSNIIQSMSVAGERVEKSSEDRNIKEDTNVVTKESISKEDISITDTKITTVGTTNGDLHLDDQESDEYASDGEGGRKIVRSKITKTSTTVTKKVSDVDADDEIDPDERENVEEITTQEIGEDGKIITKTVKTVRTYVTVTQEGEESGDSDFEDEDNVESTAAEDGSDCSRISKTTTSFTTVTKRDDNGVRSLSTDSSDKTGDIDADITKMSTTVTTIAKTLSGDDVDEIVTTTVTKEVTLEDGTTTTSTTHDTIKGSKKEEDSRPSSTEGSKPVEVSEESSPSKMATVSTGHDIPIKTDSEIKIEAKISSEDDVAGKDEKLSHSGSKLEEKKVVNGHDSDKEVKSSVDGVQKSSTDYLDESSISGKKEGQSSSIELMRSTTPGSDVLSDHDVDIGHGPSTPHSDISSGQVSRVATNIWESSEGRPDSRHCDSDEDDEDEPGSPLSVTSQLAHSPPSQFDFEMGDRNMSDFDTKQSTATSVKHKEGTSSQYTTLSMTSSLYGSLPPDPLQQLLQGEKDKESHISSSYESEAITSKDNVMTSSFYGSLEEDSKSTHSKPIGAERLQEDVPVDLQSAMYEHRAARGKDLTSTSSSYYESTSSPSHVTKYESYYTSGLNGQKQKDEHSIQEYTEDYGNGNVAAGKQFEDLMNQNHGTKEEKYNGKAGAEFVDPLDHSFHQETYTKTVSGDVLKEKKCTATGVSGVSTEHDPMFHHQFASSASGSSFTEHSQGFPQSSVGKTEEKQKDPIADWGKPLGLPAPAPPPTNNSTTVGEVLPPNTNKGTPKKEKKTMHMKRTMIMNENNKAASGQTGKETKSKRPESPVKQPSSERKGSSNKDGSRNLSGSKAHGNPIYIDLTYVPHHGNSYYTTLEFFKKVRARYYVFSGTEPSREVYNALLDAKQTWEDKELEVTIIPTYDTDTLGYWVAENEDTLAKYKIDLSPSASRCTINLQDHETSCSAYRLEF